VAVPVDTDIRVPHMGWNTVTVKPEAKELFASPSPMPAYYFCHSFMLTRVPEELVMARTVHGGDVIAAVRADTVFATQFHPEKSQLEGERLLGAFLAWKP
jgi:glutamine amidotransferase